MKSLRLRFLLSGISSCAGLFAYDPPIGIPDPVTQFGWEIDRPTPSFPAGWLLGVPIEVANHFYIDKTHPSATDTSNPYGYPGKPRVHIPEGELTAGAFVYIHAGTYGTGDSGGPRFNWFGTGTTGSPIWITGNPSTRPIIQDECQIGDGGPASFFIIENLEIQGTGSLVIRGAADNTDVDHVLVRNVLRVGTQNGADAGGGIIVGGAGSASSDPTPNSDTSDVVIYNCVIRDVGKAALEPPNGDGSDDHGVAGGIHLNRLWVLDNQLYHNGGDSIQGSHHGNYDTRLVSNFYIGRNLCHSNGENGIDIKCVQGFVISQNTVYGPFAREQGWGIVAHYGANSAFAARNGSILFNNIYHVSGGIYTSFSAGCDNLDIIGNRIWDIKRSYGVINDNINGAVIMIGGQTVGFNSVFRIADNTFHDYDRGILVETSPGDTIKVHGNIFSNRADPTYYEIDVTDNDQSGITLDYNIYTGTPAFRWASSSRTLNYMKTTAGQEANSLLTAPAFVNAAGGDFGLTITSPAIDSSVEGPVGDSAYTAHETKYGVSIRFDHTGRVRPVDGLWDRGAIESALPPAAPSALTLP